MIVFRSLTLGAALVLGASTLAAAQPPATPQAPRGQAGARHPDDQGPRERSRGPRGDRAGIGGGLLRGIELTEAQRTQLRAIGEKYRPQMQALMPERRSRAEGRARAERPARPDSAARAQRFAQMQTLRRQQATEIRALLTPEQQKTFDANHARMEERMTKMREARADRRERPDAERRRGGRRGATE